MVISLAKIAVFTLLLVCCSLVRSSAQTNRTILGTVTDTEKTGLPDIKVKLIAGKDTLTALTDQDGNFSFAKINTIQFQLQVIAAGYQDFKTDYSFADKEKRKRVKDIQLKVLGRALKEVVIREKPNPVKFMQDTVEYNALAFRVNEGDNVADLLKQLPGVEVDDAYNAKAQGKPMTKLRINGKDFFTDNVREFIGKLPAGIVSKIQVIDDFGDYANFTGIKIGEPDKMLNIVTKPGMNRGTFGSITADAGTNDLIGGQAQVNFWNDDKQNSATVDASTSNNGAGSSKQFGIGLSHNDKLGKNGTGGLGYNFRNNSTAFNREQETESLNPDGNFINDTQSDGNSSGGSHNLHWNMNYNDKKVFMQANVNGIYSYSNSESNSFIQQSGLIRQDIDNINSSNNSSPSLSAGISLSKKQKNPNNILSVNASFSLSGGNGAQHIGTNTRYYDKGTGLPLKDSLLNRDVYSKTNGEHFGFGFNYSFNLKKPKDTLARRSLNFVYNGAASTTDNQIITYVLDNLTNKTLLVDSLSTNFKSVSFNQSLGVNYNYGSGKMRYNLGFNANSSMLSNRDLRLRQTIDNNTVNYSSNFNFSRTFASNKILSFYYQGSTRSPTLNELQPIRNSQSLQNIVEGNPDLKTSFSHSLNINFNYAHKSGRSVQVGVSASTTQNEIVSNVILVPDTLNTLKQITRYENINGNYQASGNYLLLIPVDKNKYSISYSGRLGFSNHVILFNNQKTSGAGFNLSQQLSGNLSFKKISLNAQMSYTVTGNNSSGTVYPYQTIGIGQISLPTFFKTTTLSSSLQSNLRLEKLRLNGGVNYSTTHNDAAANQVVRDNSNININLGGQLTIRKSFFTDFNAIKRVNYGYTLATTPSPLLVNIGIGKTFLKDKSLNVGIRGNDLLGQGNALTRLISGNTITDSRNIKPTRVFSLNLSYNLSNFGGKHMRVDPD